MSKLTIPVWLVNLVNILYIPAESSGHYHTSKWSPCSRSTGTALTAWSQDTSSSDVLLAKGVDNAWSLFFPGSTLRQKIGSRPGEPHLWIKCLPQWCTIHNHVVINQSYSQCAKFKLLALMVPLWKLELCWIQHHPPHSLPNILHNTFTCRINITPWKSVVLAVSHANSPLTEWWFSTHQVIEGRLWWWKW